MDDNRAAAPALRFRLIVFDFDGTLVDSNLLKREGFDHVFADRPECLRALPGALQDPRNGSRVEIIASLVGRMTGLAPAERHAEAVRRTRLYTAWVEEQIAQRAADSPAAMFLPQWHKAAALYVCSLTPTAALVDVLRRIDWLQYFDGVEGYPVSKGEMLQRTVGRHGLPAGDALMVGDGDGDEAAAQEAGTAFFRIGTVADLARLDEYLLR